LLFGHKRLIVIDPENGKQPMIETLSSGDYVICYNGQIYNTKELRKTLEENGFTFKGHCDTEVLLKSYIYYGNDIVNHLNGIFAFAIWNAKKNELFLARDHFGVKPLFYTLKENTFIFASEIKALFKYPGINKILDSQGVAELFGIGPSHTAGYTVFKNIFELRPAHFAIFNPSGIHIQRYWKLKSEKHTDNFEDTCEKVKFLLNDAITRQLISDVPLCTFLSRWLRF
jgi:asparagine synthase (glutamine-hydrolysing)